MDKSCIIDNWSLFLVSEFLKEKSYYAEQIEKSISFGLEQERISDISKSFGALSNVINGLIFYENIYYLENGSESSWKNNPLADSKFSKILSSRKPPENLLQKYNSNIPSNEAKFYMLTAELTGCDLLVSPYRSDIMLKSSELSVPSVTNDLINEIDGKISDLLLDEKDLKLKVGIESNQLLPSLTQLVLNDCKNINDVFEVAAQIKESDCVKNYKSRISELLSGNDVTKNYVKLKKDFESIYDNTIFKLGMRQKDKEQSFNAAFNLWIFKISNIKIPYSTKIRRNRKHLILLKNIAKCRLEMYNSQNTLKRILR